MDPDVDGAFEVSPCGDDVRSQERRVDVGGDDVVGPFHGGGDGHEAAPGPEL